MFVLPLAVLLIWNHFRLYSQYICNLTEINTCHCRHYDWGLRAIKSVLVVAGSLLRAQEGQVESDVLFRALRDFNIPKILSQDMVIFVGLLSDLFPGVEPPRKRDLEFEKVQAELISQMFSVAFIHWNGREGFKIIDCSCIH